MISSLSNRAGEYLYKHLPVVLAVYFIAHVIVRVASSPTLGFDESEQAYFSQSLQLGYNSQPPLYTWLQTAIFELLGYSTLSLALLKNAFLFATYYITYRVTLKMTGDQRLAVIAAIGLLFIPQVSWESHRDLSHTVAATFNTLLLLWSIVSLRSSISCTAIAQDGAQTPARPPRTRECFFGYLMIGISVGAGMMFKYNFAIVTLAFFAAACSMPSFRTMLQDRRIVASVFVALLIIGPHAVWVFNHPELASSKTIETLTSEQTHHWMRDVLIGFTALSVSILSCSVLLMCVFATFLFGRSRRLPSMSDQEMSGGNGDDRLLKENAMLLERFLLVVVALLLGLVLTGHAIEFKNRWLQPFVCVLPVYFVTRFRSRIVDHQGALNEGAAARVIAAGVIVMAVVLAMTLTRPMIRAQRGNYGLLNVPYGQAAEQIGAIIESDPDLIIVQDTRVAGNLRMKFRGAKIISQDAADNISELRPQLRQYSGRILVVHQAHDPAWRVCESQSNFVSKLLDRPTPPLHWKQVDVPYLYSIDDAETFRYAVFDLPKVVAYHEKGIVHRR